MKLTDLWRTKGKPTVSFEVFPARDPDAAGRLDKALGKLAAVKPDFFSVTFGAGGSTREGSRGLVERLRKTMGFEVVAYFACYGLGPDDITGALDAYRDLGVDNVLAVRGDPPHDAPDFRPHPQSLAHASDLVAFLRPRYGFCLGVAGYPEGHVEAVGREEDLDYLRLKVDAGAEYVIANYFYDNRFYFEFVERARARGIAVPILPGVMPIYGVKMMENLATLCGATITDGIRAGLAALPPGDKDAVGNFGIDLAARQCADLLRRGAPGLHLYTMDRSRSAVEIVTRLRAEGLL